MIDAEAVIGERGSAGGRLRLDSGGRPAGVVKRSGDGRGADAPSLCGGGEVFVDTEADYKCTTGTPNVCDQFGFEGHILSAKNENGFVPTARTEVPKLSTGCVVCRGRVSFRR